MTVDWLDPAGSSPRRVPIDRNGVDSMIDLMLAQNSLLEELLNEVKKSNSVERTGAVSSVEVKDLANGKPQISTKRYSGSEPEVEAALADHALAHREYDRLSMQNWQATIDALRGDAA